MNVGPHRRSASASTTTAKEQFAKVARARSRRTTTRTIGLGVALRGLKDLDGAEAQYKKAQEHRRAARRGLLQPRRPLQGLPRDQAGRPQGVARHLRQAKELLPASSSTRPGDAADKAEAKEQVDADRQDDRRRSSSSSRPRRTSRRSRPDSGARSGSPGQRGPGEEVTAEITGARIGNRRPGSCVWQSRNFLERISEPEPSLVVRSSVLTDLRSKATT